MKIYLDDVRMPYNNEWVLCRSVDEFKMLVRECIRTNNPITELSFDHDLGQTLSNIDLPSGKDATNWFIELAHDNEVLKETLERVIVHSSNPAGNENIASYFENASKNGIFGNIQVDRRM